MPSLTPQLLQTLVLGLRMMKKVLRKTSQTHQSLSLHTHPMVRGVSSYITCVFINIFVAYEKAKRFSLIAVND